MSTPRTDKFIDSCGDYEKWHSYRDRLHDFARSLERENDVLKAQNEQLRSAAKDVRFLLDTWLSVCRDLTHKPVTHTELKLIDNFRISLERLES